MVKAHLECSLTNGRERRSGMFLLSTMFFGTDACAIRSGTSAVLRLLFLDNAKRKSSADMRFARASSCQLPGSSGIACISVIRGQAIVAHSARSILQSRHCILQACARKHVYEDQLTSATN